MINSQNLINKICACISGGGLTALQSCQLNGALNVLCAPVCSVVTSSNLPTATDNVGRMIYVHAENRYYHAVDGCWLNDFQSTPFVYENAIYNWGIFISSPTSFVSGFNDWCQISAGNGFSVAMRPNGSIWSWGGGTAGNLGNDCNSNTTSPVSAVGGFTDWCQASAGWSHSVAVRASGSAWSWGYNNRGQLGDNTTTNRSSPVSVVGGFTDWCQTAAGCRHSLAVRINGSAWAWGEPFAGKLGDNQTLSNRLSPVSVRGGFTDWCLVSGDSYHSMGIRSSGSAWAWGLNDRGQLGNNSGGAAQSCASPVSVVGGFSDWRQVTLGRRHSVGLRSSGSTWAWGDNQGGLLGNNTTGSSRLSPVSVVGGFTNWCQVSAGTYHTLAIRTNGTLWAWGCNTQGRLGDNTTTERLSPVSVVGGFSDWSQVSAKGGSLGLRYKTKGF